MISRRVANLFRVLAFATMPALGVASPARAATDSGPQPVAKDVVFANYRFRSGETLAQTRIHYATLGTPHRDARGTIDNAILLLHWTGNSGRSLMSPEYMQSLYAAGKPLDANRYYLILPDNFGHGASSKPSDGLRMAFPHYGYEDLVDLQHKLVTETLGIPHLRAIIGVSMGGMNAWQWAELYPDAMDGVMPVVSLPARVSGRNLLWRRLVIDSIEADPAWDHGNYTQKPPAYFSGYELLRMMIDGVPHLQAIIPDTKAAEAHLAKLHADVAGGDPNDLIYSLDSSRDYDPELGLSRIRTKVFALNFSDDEFNPDRLQILQKLAPTVPGASYVVQEGTPTSYGHLTMAHPALWAQHVETFMTSLGPQDRATGH